MESISRIIIPVKAIKLWSSTFKEALNTLAEENDYVLFTSAYVSKTGVRYLTGFGKIKRIVGIIRSYRNPLLSPSRAYSHTKYLPGLHSKMILYLRENGKLRVSSAIIWSGNITKRSIEEELNHFLVVRDYELLRKLLDDFNIMLKHSVKSNIDEPKNINIGLFNTTKVTTNKVKQLAEGYLRGKVSLSNALSYLNKTIPFYQILFSLLVANKITIHSFIFEPLTLKRMLLPLVMKGVNITLVTSPRPAVAHIRRLNKKLLSVGKEPIKLVLLKKLHTKSLIVRTRKGEEFAYIGSATISRSALYYEINHGIFTRDKEVIKRLKILE